MTYSHEKVQGQWSVGSEDRVETNGRTGRWTDGLTDVGDCITSVANAVGTYDVEWIELKHYALSETFLVCFNI